MGGCLFALGLLCYLIGFIQLVNSLRKPAPAAQQPYARTIPPAPMPERAPASPSYTPSPEASVNTPQNLSHIRTGDRIRVQHPVQGELTLYVLGSAAFVELWQTSRGPQSPWVPTGNSFLGFWLENNLLLLNWLNRYYLLEESVPVTDVDIQRDFAPYARQFAQSNQTADVYFAYPPASWHIDDIGKFRLGNVEGEGFRQRSGATGRFIHASGDGRRALVVEDYEGGGQDMVWLGCLIDPESIQKV